MRRAAPTHVYLRSCASSIILIAGCSQTGGPSPLAFAADSGSPRSELATAQASPPALGTARTSAVPGADLRVAEPPRRRPGQCAPGLFPAEACRGKSGPWGEALQKALWFFHVNRSGSGIACDRVQWRGDSHVSDARIRLDPDAPNGVDLSRSFITAHRSELDPDGDGTLDLSGGFYDAGDYIKFGMTSGFAASLLAYSLWEYPEAYQRSGLEAEARVLLRWFADYFMRGTFLDAQGALLAFAHQVGDGSDHTCGWMPPELRTPESCPRRAYFASAEKPAADVTASAAAALALTALVTRDSDSQYAERCARHARALYDFAAAHPTAKANADGGLYTSEYAADDLAWAASWLFELTSDMRYLDDTLSPGGWLEGFPGFQLSCLQWDTSCWTEAWTHCWNSVRSGVFLHLASLLDRGADAGKYAGYAKGLWRTARDSAVDWADGSVAQSPGGFSFLAGWGSGRYNAAAQFIALTYARRFEARDPALAQTVRSWATRQIEYLLGNNPLGKSYVMGISDHYATQPHHAAGHASITGQPDDPPENGHVVWGALVNGPADASDHHVDRRSDYGSNEVTIDYNASLVAALAAHYTLHDAQECGLPDFPPIEPPATELYTRSMLNGAAGSCRSQVDLTLVNHTQHPPRFAEQLSVRYYFDIAELRARGGGISDVTGSIIYDNGLDHGEPTRLRGPVSCPADPNLYYYELGYQGYRFWGALPQLKSPRRAILELGVAYGPGCTWDETNDFSHAGLSQMQQRSPQVPAYDSAKRVWGEAPHCGDEPPPPDSPLE